MSDKARVPPPLPGDVAIAAESLGWPPVEVEVDGRLLDGEAAWRQFVNSATPDELQALWERDWGGRELAVEDDDEEDLADGDADDDDELADEADDEDDDEEAEP